jgi:hypothetical protein
MLLPVRPDVFDRIQFRRVGRQVLHANPPFQLVDVVSDHGTAVSRQAVPDQQERLANVPHQCRQEIQHLRTLHGARVKTKIEVPSCQTCGSRQTLPVKVVLQHRRLAARCPGSASMRALTQSAFVDEDDGTPFPAGFFLMAGQVLLFHVRICCSLRSRALPVGRCGLHPRPTSTFQT